MAKSLSARFGLQRWSADSDTQQRSEFDNDAAQLELYAAKAGHGTIGARPAAAAAWADGYWLITDATGGGVLGTLYVCDGATWTTFAPRKQGLATNRPAAALAQQHYYKTDSDLLSIDDGAAWHDFPSKAVTDAAYVAKSGTLNALVATQESTASTSFTDLTTVGPAVSPTTSTRALVILTAKIFNSSAGVTTRMGFAVSGATTVAVDSEKTIRVENGASVVTQLSATYMVTGLNAGVNTFTTKYAVTAGTGSFANREITVIPL